MSERCQALNVGYKQCRKKAKGQWYVTPLERVKAEKVAVWLCRDHLDWPKDKRK